jgi:prepilin-type N-terminal cleavage/methylation domain-containing protein
MRRRTHRSAFSLLELLAVITILGIMALVVIPRIGFSSAAAKENACFQNKAEINAAVERYMFNSSNGALPANINALNNATYFPDGIPVCPVSGSSYALDNTTKRVRQHTPGNH